MNRPPTQPRFEPEPGQILGEALATEPGCFEAHAAAAGEPGLPLAFRWRGREFVLGSVERRWRSTGRDRGGSQEQYVRRHWAVVTTVCGVRMRIYGERGHARRRWWLHCLEARRPASGPPRGGGGTQEQGPAGEG